VPEGHWTLPDIPQGDVIPRILHQHFLAGEAAIPDTIRPIRDALRAANPTWEYRFWDAARAEAFIAESYGPQVLDLYRRIRPEYYAARSDLLRYLVMYVQGGIYLDIKSTCDRPLDDTFGPDDRFLLLHFEHLMDDVRTPEVDRIRRKYMWEIAHVPNGEYVQWVIVTVPGHPFLRAVIERVLSNIAGYSPLRFGMGGFAVLRVTGPIAYTLTIDAIRDRHAHSAPVCARDRGFIYSGLGSQWVHAGVFGSAYYRKLNLPICAISPAYTFVYRVCRRLMRLPLARKLAFTLHRRFGICLT
jgi:hypothetical protein